MTDEQVLITNAHIPNSEVEQDIIDTEQEIETMRREEQGFRLIGDRMSLFRADARRDEIKAREAFVIKLKRLLKLRESMSLSSCR